MRRPCKRCGAPLLFVVGPSGRTLPLDLRSLCYRVEGLEGEPEAAGPGAHADPLFSGLGPPKEAPRAVKAEGVFVSHFQTCPAASEFSSHASGPRPASSGRRGGKEREA